MRSRTTEAFRRQFSRLPEDIQRQTREAYTLFQDNPRHPSLRFKQVHPSRPIFSVRISRDYRVVGIREGEEIVWFWIGSHTDYEQLLARQ